jgi:hypothetical protein
MVATDSLQAVGDSGDVFTFNLSVLDAAGQPLPAATGSNTALPTSPDGSIPLTAVRLT